MTFGNHSHLKSDEHHFQIAVRVWCESINIFCSDINSKTAVFRSIYNGMIVEYAIFIDEHSKRNIEIIICKHTYERKSMLFSTNYSQRHKIDSMLIVLLIAHILMHVYE